MNKFAIRKRVDNSIRAIWLMLRDLSDFPDGMTDFDLELFNVITKHPAIQDPINKNIKNGEDYGINKS